METPIRILCLEDDPRDAELVRETLGREGMAATWRWVQTESDFKAALDGEAFDLILADYKLPSFDGPAAMRIAQERCPDLPFIFVSGAIGEEAAIDTLKNGATDYVLKHRLAKLGPAVQRSLHEQSERRLRQRAELELRELNATLEDRVQQRTSELVALNIELQQEIAKREKAQAELRLARDAADAANRAKSEFLATMSHELRTPLNGVIGMTDLLLGTSLDAQQRRYATLAKSSGDCLLRLISDILDFSKVEAGKLELECAAFDLQGAIESVAATFANPAAQKGLKLDVRVEPGLSQLVWGDSGRLQQVLTNLLGNALKFTEQGEIVLQATLDERTERHIIARVTITDTGIGIPQSQLDRLFVSFSQGDASTTRKYGGTGLGLAICKRLVEMMEGRIGVTSEPGAGSTFWFTVRLPTSSEEPRCLAPAAGVGSSPARPARVLLAEDDQVSRESVVSILARAGHQCDVAVNGKEALEAVSSRCYDLVFMDCRMPVMDGLAATRAIRRAEHDGLLPGRMHRPRLPIVALTANAIAGDRQRCLDAGMDEYLSKPLRADKLLDVVESFVSRPSQGVERADLREGELPPAPEPPGTPPSRHPAADSAFDHNALRKHWGRDWHLAADLIPTFQKEAPRFLAGIEKCVLSANAAEASRLAHALKGAASYVCADAVRQLSAQVETFAAVADLCKAETCLLQLRAEVERCLKFDPHVLT